jgi:molybdopterin/thiamine biosynthesis adenylyltransferase/ubiquitin-protein ligase
MFDTIQNRTKKAVEAVSLVLKSNSNFECLCKEEVDARKNNYLAGWRTVNKVEGIGCELELYLPSFFPDSPPEIYISSNPEKWFCKTPHVEPNGKICIIAESAAIDSDAPIDLVRECLKGAVDILTIASEDEFRDEALVYWGLQAKGYRAYCCASISDLGSKCVIVKSGNDLIIAENDHSAEEWYRNWKGSKVIFDLYAPCIVVRCQEVFVPSNYPESCLDVRVLIERYAPDVLAEFDEYICRGTRLFGVVFLQSSKEGSILAGIVSYGQNLDCKKEFIKGFRKEKAPTSLLINLARNYLNKQQVKRLRITRADSHWVHSRGGTGLDLVDKTITLIGCGSLGGYVGHLLARAGIGHLRLLDNDKLGWENVGRHLLGATKVGRSKSESLAEKLTQELPHLDVSSFNGDWREWIQTVEGKNSFLSSDIIISTVADWRCERPLNLTIKELGKNSIFAWLEPYGLAAHVLACGPQGGCLECGMDSLGNFQSRVFDFELGTLRKEPGGCAYYQEYGPTKIFPLASLIVDTAIHRLIDENGSSMLYTILGDLTSVDKYGGNLRKEYSDYVTENNSRIIEKKWLKNPCCACCQPKNYG